jgi:tetratricopeptide (TPR) repeat protein
VSQTPQRLTGSRKYEEAWRAVNMLIRSDGSWSGGERKVSYRNRGDGSFEDISFVSGLDSRADGRAFVTFDLDGDGALDLALKSRTEPQVRILRNVLAQAGTGLRLDLIGSKGNRDAVGARVTAMTDRGSRLMREVGSGSGFLSQSSRRLHFGIPKGERIGKLEVRWPSGLVQSFPNPPQRGLHRLREGATQLTEFDSRPASVQPDQQSLATRTPGTWLVDPVPAPELALEGLDGKTHRLIDDRGVKVLVNFWASWCQPCRSELADFTTHAREFEEAGVRVLTVSVDEPSARAEVAAIKLPFPSLFADDRFVGVYTVLKRHIFDRRTDLELPTSFLVDEAGEIVKVYRGPTTASAVRRDAGTRERAALPFPGRRYTPAPVRNYTELATAMAERGFTREAQALFETALRKGQGGFELYNNFAGLLIAGGELNRAEDLLRASLKANPHQSDARSNLGRLLLDSGRPEMAVPYLEEAVRAVPDDAASRRGLAAAHAEVAIGHMEAGRRDDARAAFLKAVEADPTDPASRINLALFYAKAGEAVRALELVEAARRLDPESPTPALLEAEIFLGQGKRAEARQVLNRLLRAHPNSREAQELLKQTEP